MDSNAAIVHRRDQKYVSDDRRVITRYLNFGDPRRIKSILSRILSIPDARVPELLAEVREAFCDRHRDLEAAFRNHAHQVEPCLAELVEPGSIGRDRRLLIGAYFTLEYSIESAALFNPSIVDHPDQSGLDAGELRFIMSLRATGEGHISSIVFRTGVIRADGEIRFDPAPRFAFTAKPVPDRQLDKQLFRQKLEEMGELKQAGLPVLDCLDDPFTCDELEAAIDREAAAVTTEAFKTTVASMRWLAQANYELEFPRDADPAELVIFPNTELESRGMEDLRLVRFLHEDGTVSYHGTYTAFDGVRIVPMMLETRDFRHFHIGTLNGAYAMNKGMALFPRKVGGEYAMISRHDGENLYLLTSPYLHFWNTAVPLESPREPWEMVQIGNCGSPVETPEGWLLLTHGVGPVRRYCIGAMLLDLEDPSRVIGRLREPLIVPTGEEREGYVPNVVYSCGAMIHGDELVIPYAMSDVATTIATVPLDELLDRLKAEGP